jgi:mannosyltransferase
MSLDSPKPALAGPEQPEAAALAASPASSSARALDTGAPSRRAGRAPGISRLTPYLAGAMCLLLGAWQISRLSFNQDEAATISAIRRPFGSMLAVLGHIDAVHGAYYLIMHLVFKLDQSEAVLRAPSVLAMAGSAVLIAMIGTKLADWRAGLAAGSLFALCWLTTEYAQDARPFALATFFAVVASYRFVVLMEKGTRAAAAWYSASVAACALINVFALLIVVAHAITLLISPLAKARLRGYAVAAGAAMVVVSPVAWLAATQVSQVGWEQRPRPVLVVTIVAVLVIVSALSFIAARVPPIGDQADDPDPRPRASLGTAPLIRLSAPWLVVPVAILLAFSQVPVTHSPGQPAGPGNGIWEPRYLLFCLPAAMLLVAAMAARLPRRAAWAAMAACVIAAAATQPLARPPVSPDDLRAVSALIGRLGRQGDAVVFPNVAKRLITDAYPAGFRKVRDVGLDTAPSARDSLYGLNVSAPVLSRRLAHVRRIWVVMFPVRVPPEHYAGQGDSDAFCLRRSWLFPLNMVLLYQHCQS